MPATVSAEQRALLQWGESVRRDLPWRRTRDPWAVLVSEVMLQQTSVDRVVPRFDTFLDRWPNPAALAAAPLAEVLGAWSGLGYPRRARDLHRSAAAVVEGHGGEVPGDIEALLALPGVGPYTARAVLVFAFERGGIGVVDTNVARILARRSGRRLGRREVQAEADLWVPEGHAWAHHQSLMDLGAAICRPTPRCDQCPLSGWCAWGGGGRTDPDPAIGTAGVSTRQAPFDGSDRQARGRLLAALIGGDVTTASLPAAAGLVDDPARARRLADALVAEGLAERSGRRWHAAGQAAPRVNSPGSR